jgi:hypothetical protein
VVEPPHLLPAGTVVVVRRWTETRAQLDASLIKNRLNVDAWVHADGPDIWAVIVREEHLAAASQQLKLPTIDQQDGP